jgi:ribosomal protein L11
MKPLQSIKCHVAAGEASKEPPVGPMLGQYQVNIVDFINRFNTTTAVYEKGVLLSTLVIRDPNTRIFTIVLKGPSLRSLLDNFLVKFKRKKIISSAKLHDLCAIKYRWALEHKLISSDITFSAFTKSILAVLRSYKKIFVYVPKNKLKTIRKNS